MNNKFPYWVRWENWLKKTYTQPAIHHNTDNGLRTATNDRYRCYWFDRFIIIIIIVSSPALSSSSTPYSWQAPQHHFSTRRIISAPWSWRIVCLHSLTAGQLESSQTRSWFSHLFTERPSQYFRQWLRVGRTNGVEASTGHLTAWWTQLQLPPYKPAPVQSECASTCDLIWTNYQQ